MRRVRSKKLLALLLACLMVLTLTPFAFAEELEDIEDSWAKDSIERWVGEGVVGGKGDGKFDPEGQLTRAEGATIITRLLNMKTDPEATLDIEDIVAGSWYVPYMAAAYNAKIMNGDAGKLMPLDIMTREQYFVVVCNALGIAKEDPAEDATEFPDADAVEGWAEGYVNALVNMGMVTGIDGNLVPLQDISRAEVMGLLNAMIGGYANEDGDTITAETGKFTVVVADNVTVTGEVDKPIVVAADGATVDLKGVTGTVEVIVKADDVELTNVPVGTVLTTPNEETTVTVNGKKVDLTDEKDVTVEASQPSSPSYSGTTTDDRTTDTASFSVYVARADSKVYIINSDTTVADTYTLGPDATITYELRDDALVITAGTGVEFVSVKVNNETLTKGVTATSITIPNVSEKKANPTKVEITYKH